MKKTIATVLILLTSLVTFTGCEQVPLPAPENPVTLNMWHVYGSQTKSPLNTVIDEFNSTVGKEQGITVNVVSVTSSSAIDKALSSSANGEPGAEAMPDLFTAYPRVVEIVGKETLLSWDEYFTKEELGAFNSEFLYEGYFDSELLMLPIAKSTEAFYLNKTVFDRFSKDTGITTDKLGNFKDLFEVARKYYDWSNGMDFMQFNDYYNYAYVGMNAYGSEFVRNGRLRLDDEDFRKVWIPLAETAIYGGICLEDGYAAARWKTMEVIANTGSTADVLYQPTEIIYPDNTTESIEAVSLPYPIFTYNVSGVIHRGGGLFAVKNDDERKNSAAYIFAKWLTEKEHNLDFVTHAGYLSVTDDALESLLKNTAIVEKDSYRGIYETVNEMFGEYTFLTLPIYSGASKTQFDFEANVKTVLKAARNQYLKRIEQGEIPETLLAELVETSLAELKNLSDK